MFSISPLKFSFLSESYLDGIAYRPRTFLVEDVTPDESDEVSELDLSNWWENLTETPDNITTTTTMRPEYPEVMREDLERVLGPEKGPKPTSKRFKNWDFNKPFEEAKKYITDYECN